MDKWISVKDRRRTPMKPILFNTDMVRAILEGNKTVTRRVAFHNKNLRKFPRPDNPDAWWFRGRVYTNWDSAMRSPQGVLSLCRYKEGDILYVRETWDNEPITPGGHFRPGGVWYYKADGDLRPETWRGNWHPSIHMPKEAARLFLRVTAVRVERLQDITPEQARAEGCDGRCNCPSSGSSGSLSCVIRDFSVEKFETVWDGTIKPADLDKYGWNANPWVWVIEFERISREEA